MSALGSQTALARRSAGAANDLRNTRRLISRNEYDYAVPSPKSASHRKIPQPLSQRDDKVLNLCMESKCRAVVTIRAIAQNKFINRLRLIAAQKRFQSARSRYADK
jgi:hypothetical protein